MIRESEDGTGSRRPLLGDAGIVTPPDSQRKGRCRNAAAFFAWKRSGSPSYNLSVSLRSTAPLVGEPLAKPFTLRGLPKPPLGRGGGSASALTERLSPAAAHGQASILSFPYNHQQKEPQHLVTGTAALFNFSSRSWLTSPCLRLQQRSRQNASPGPRP